MEPAAAPPFPSRGDPAPPHHPPPAEPALAHRIATLARAAAAAGPGLVAHVAAQHKADPAFAFLTPGGEGSAHWAWALHAAVQATAPPPPPPPPPSTSGRRASRWDAPPPGRGRPDHPPPPPPADPFAFPPGLIPVLIRDAAAAGAPPYTPLDPAAIAAAAMPAPPADGGRADPHLSGRLAQFFAEVGAYTPGLTRAEVEMAAKGAAAAAAVGGGGGGPAAGVPGLATLAGGPGRAGGGGHDPNTAADGRFIGGRGRGGRGRGPGHAAGLGYDAAAAAGGGGGGGAGRRRRRGGGGHGPVPADPYAAYRSSKARTHRADVINYAASRRAAERELRQQEPG